MRRSMDQFWYNASTPAVFVMDDVTQDGLDHLLIDSMHNDERLPNGLPNSNEEMTSPPTPVSETDMDADAQLHKCSNTPVMRAAGTDTGTVTDAATVRDTDAVTGTLPQARRQPTSESMAKAQEGNKENVPPWQEAASVVASGDGSKSAKKARQARVQSKQSSSKRVRTPLRKRRRAPLRDITTCIVPAAEASTCLPPPVLPVSQLQPPGQPIAARPSVRSAVGTGETNGCRSSSARFGMR